jgi:hypothetical protein
MADQIVITEKFSQAKDVRAAVGSRYGDILPAEGHLLDLLEPEDVVQEWKRWSPILLRPEGLYGTRPAQGGNKAAKLRAIREALRTAKRVWLATDCDREGQLIGQEILEHYEYRGQVMRVLFTVNEAEADRVRGVFRGYLKLGSLNLLMADLGARGIVTKVRTLKTGETVGGIPFTRGPLAHLLRNRFYIGEVAFKGEILAGEQPAIVDKGLFEAVQAKLSQQVSNHKVSRTKSEALLLGRIFDDRGHRMTPSHARRRGIKYRYYISSALLQGRRNQAGSVTRIPAHEVETLVVKAARNHLNDSTEIADALLIQNHVTRVKVESDQLVIDLTDAIGVGSKRKRKEPPRDRSAVAQDPIYPTP